jgi:hypothetical protein
MQLTRFKSYSRSVLFFIAELTFAQDLCQRLWLLTI